MVWRSLVQTATVAYVRRLAMEGRWVLAKRVDLDVAMSFQAWLFDPDKRWDNWKLDEGKTSGIQFGKKREKISLAFDITEHLMIHMVDQIWALGPLYLREMWTY